MARINLLPWRVERRVQRTREFYVMLGVAAAGALLVSGLIYMYYTGQISGQNDRNAFLTQEIEKVKAQNAQIDTLETQKARLLARKEVIEKLQSNRSQMVHLFDSLVRTIPDGVVLTSLKQEGDILTLMGRSQSNARVSAYMRNLEGSGWMTNPDLSIIEAKNEAPAGGAPTAPVLRNAAQLPFVFTLSVKLANPNAPAEDGTTPAAGAAPGSPAAPGAVAPATVPAAAPVPATPAQGKPAS